MLVALLKSEGSSRRHLEYCNILNRLDEQFRADVHAAASAEVSEAGDAVELTLPAPGKTLIRYRCQPKEITREEIEGEKTLRRESYALPEEVKSSLEQKSEGATDHVDFARRAEIDRRLENPLSHHAHRSRVGEGSPIRTDEKRRNDNPPKGKEPKSKCYHYPKLTPMQCNSLPQRSNASIRNRRGMVLIVLLVCLAVAAALIAATAKIAITSHQATQSASWNVAGPLACGVGRGARRRETRRRRRLRRRNLDHPRRGTRRARRRRGAD